MAVLVSVYCLAYNHEKYIRDTLDGFVNQKVNFEYEVFVHDDASTDSTATIILEYAEKYPEIIKPIIQKENQYSKGISIFKEYILPKISGKYIAACEGDDYWCDVNKLQVQVDFLTCHQDYVACSHNSIVYNQQTGQTQLFSQKKNNRTVNMKEIINWKCVYQTSSLLYRSNIREHSPLQIIGGIGDLPLSLWLRFNGKIFYIAQPMSVYRCNVSDSWSQKYNDQNINAKNTILILQSFNCISNNKYKYHIDRRITELYVGILYRNNDMEGLRNIGYLKLIFLGYWRLTISLFLKIHNNKLYKIIRYFIHDKC